MNTTEAKTADEVAGETAKAAPLAMARTSEQLNAIDTIALAQIRIQALVSLIECALESAENPQGNNHTPTHQDMLEVTSLMHELSSTSRTALRAF